MKSWTTYLVLPSVSLKTLPQLNYYILSDKCEDKPLTTLLGWSLAFHFHVLEFPFIAGRTVDYLSRWTHFITCFLDHFCATDGHVFNKLGFAGLILQVHLFSRPVGLLWISSCSLGLLLHSLFYVSLSFHFEEQYYKPLSQNFVDLPTPLPFLTLCFHIIKATGELENILFEWCLNFLALIYVQIEYIFFVQIICNRILFYM